MKEKTVTMDRVQNYTLLAHVIHRNDSYIHFSSSKDH